MPTNPLTPARLAEIEHAAQHGIEHDAVRHRRELLDHIRSKSMSKIGSIESYESKALTFYKMTGMLATGKDVPAAMYQDSFEARNEAWNKWLEEHGEVVNAAVLACW